MAHPISSGISAQEFAVLKGTADRDFKNVRSRAVWSTLHLHSQTGGQITAGLLAAGDYPIFVTASGKAGQGLPAGQLMTDADTNFPGEGRMGDDQNMAIWELGISLLPSRQQIVALGTGNMADGPVAPPDVDQFLSNVLVIKYVDVEINLGPLSTFQQAGGPFMAVPSLTDYGVDAATTAAPARIIGGLAEGLGSTPWDTRQAKLVNNSGNLDPAPALRRKLQVPIFLPKTVNFSFIIRVPRAQQLLTLAQGGTGGFRVRCDWWAVESFRDQS